MKRRFHHNVIIAAFWVAYEIFRDPKLLSRFRSDIASCADSSRPSGFNPEQLIRLPLLQSIWAETLRLRVHIFNSRQAGSKELNVNNWMIPKRSFMFVASTPAHFDCSAWNTGPNGKHPVDTFWADRFIVYPGDKSSGPNRQISNGSKGDAPYFQLDASMSGSWIPFGGGVNTCPGRQFAKREVLLTCATLASCFDIEIEQADAKLEMDWSTCGFGTLKPKRPVPFRMRKAHFEV
jgi:cytochrome P450